MSKENIFIYLTSVCTNNRKYIFEFLNKYEEKIILKFDFVRNWVDSYAFPFIQTYQSHLLLAWMEQNKEKEEETTRAHQGSILFNLQFTKSATERFSNEFILVEKRQNGGNSNRPK